MLRNLCGGLSLKRYPALGNSQKWSFHWIVFPASTNEYFLQTFRSLEILAWYRSLRSIEKMVPVIILN